MKKLILLLTFCLTIPVFAQNTKPLYQLPEINKSSSVNKDGSNHTNPAQNFLVASDNGLFRVTSSNSSLPVWTKGRVDQIVHVQDGADGSNDAFYMRTALGIIYSKDLVNFEERNNGLPYLTVKKYDGVSSHTEKQIHNLKDFCVNPANPKEMVVATKDNVYLSRDGGLNWKNIGSMSANTSGIKSCAIATMGDRCVVFMSHAIFGFSYYYPDNAKPAWIDVSAGFEIMKSLATPDEISDILPVLRKNPEDGSIKTEIYISQTFLPRIYRFNWETKRGELIYSGKEMADVIDGLSVIDDAIIFSTVESFGSLDLKTYQSLGVPAKMSDWKSAFASVPGMINSAWIPSERSGFQSGLSLSELWVLYPGTVNTPYASKADGKKSVYASAYQCRNMAGIEKYKKIMKDNKLNSMVIDMKDDYGLLRYDSKDPDVLKKAKTSMYAVTLDEFVTEFKKDDIYLIARIVVFKDRNLSQYGGSKYAVWDKVNNKPWVGIKGYEDLVDEATQEVKGKEAQYYDENWVDPYSQEVWEYNVQIANELISRGFDEIQFDYIRFPTDGLNLRNASYRWQDKGMDKESALISFLSYARENLDAPIGIDIYGANGWYRSGTRTGQDSELLCEYVDVIGPMFYPSHFEQSFLNYAPWSDRTYRIYYYGSFRNTVICRNRAIIRPWVQAFYLNVSYDRQYYDDDGNYIQKQIFGVRDSVNHGYMYWNNSGDYRRLRPDVTSDQPFTGTAPEAGPEYRKPALGTAEKPVFTDGGLSILDSIWYQNRDLDGKEVVYTPFLQVPSLKGFYE